MVKCQCGRGKCPVCGTVGYVQLLNGRYARVRHYDRSENGKPVFHYHQISSEDANRILGLTDHVENNRPMICSNDQKAITNDPESKDLASESKNKWARSPAWIKALAFGAGDLKRLDTQGSNPCGPAINFNRVSFISPRTLLCHCALFFLFSIEVFLDV